jgi:arylsulfatase A-like enzyme
MRRSPNPLAAGALLALLVLAAAQDVVPAPPAVAAAARRPNILVIVTDDQTLGTVTPATMPWTYRWFVERGRSYPRFFVSDPLCCPSRASIMTGRFDHNNGVTDNSPGPPFPLDMRTTVQCYLRRVGYTTALYGKLFNGWDYSVRPPCLDDFAITPGGAHANMPFLRNGWITYPAGWLDAYTTHTAAARIRAGAERGEPWYVYVAFTAPHAPYTPRPAFRHAPLPRPWRSPSVKQASLLGLEPAVRAHAQEHGFATGRWAAEQRMLMSVDHEVGELFGALRSTGQLENTIVFFVSDNGVLLGEHHLRGKRLPYTESIQVPFYVYAPTRAAPGSADERLTQNVDIAPTILAAAGFPRSELIAPLDGHDLLSPAWRRPYALGESWQSGAGAHWQPPWRSLRTASFQYIEYTAPWGADVVIWREYYDLRSDPAEMRNLLHDGIAANDPDVARLHAELVSAARCVGPSCP